MIILFSRGVDRDLNSDLTSLNLLAIHLFTCLLLKLLGAKRDEAKTTALARLVTSLELLDHEAGDGTESNFGGGGRVVLEDLEELEK